MRPDWFRTSRKITKVECPWLVRDVPKGMIVYAYDGHTYGVIGPDGIAVTRDPMGGTPFFELPIKALDQLEDCHASLDGDCDWKKCPQERDGEPKKSGRHCPLDRQGEEE